MIAKAIAASLKSDDDGGPASASDPAPSGDDGDGAAAKEPENQLTREEKEEKIKARLAEIKEKKAEEEKRLEKEREAARIVAGKEMLKQKRLLEDQERERLADFRKREKEEARRAKQKIMEEIERDKRERRSRMAGAGGATEPVPVAKQAKAAEDDKPSKSPFAVVKAVSTQTKVRELLVSIKQGYPEQTSSTAFRTLGAYVGNLLKSDPKFRSIRTTNNAFQQRVASLQGKEPLAVLELIGFTLEGEFYKLADARFRKADIEAALTELNNAVSNPFFGAL